jgi:integrase
MYANLMLHGGLRISETMIKHKIIKNSINIEFQRVAHDNSIQKAKTTGLVILPNWLLDEYKDWDVDCSSHRCLKDWFSIYFKSKVGIGFPSLSPHKLRHMYATYLATKVPPSVLQKQMRHSKIETTMNYYVHVDEGHLLNVLNASRNHLRVVND